MTQNRRVAHSQDERLRSRRGASRRERVPGNEGLRPVTLWLPDTSDPAFKEECRRQSLLASAADGEEQWINAWLENGDKTGWVWDE